MHNVYPRVIAWMDYEDQMNIIDYDSFIDNAKFVWWDKLPNGDRKEEMLISLYNFFVESERKEDELAQRRALEGWNDGEYD